MPIAAPPPPPVIVVEAGDNLWKIAKDHTSSAAEVGSYWRGLINANPMPNPSMIKVGQKLHAPTAADKTHQTHQTHVAKTAVVHHATSHPVQHKTVAHAPVEKYAPVYKYVPKHRVTYKHTAPAVAARAAASSSACGGDLPPCYVLQRESRGNARAENPTSTASGLWQFLDSTWQGYGGYHHASDAPVAVQNARAREVWNHGAGASAWAVH